MNPADKASLVSIMSFSYHTMRASVPLLEFALDRTEDNALREYFMKHIVEEAGHDRMLLSDLHALGVDEVTLPHRAAQFAGSQYYLIAHEHPALLLGYMRALESESVNVDDVDAISKLHGVPLSALRHHAEHDPQHKKDLDAIIAEMPANLRHRIEWNEAATKQMIEALNG